MPKGIFTQCFVILLRDDLHLQDIKPVLADFKVVKENPESENWEFGGPSLLVEFDKSVNGYVSIDIVNHHPWPDHMGDTKNEFTLLGAWTMGHFGPCTFPGNLLRAQQQAHLWPAAPQLVPQHRGFIRIRTSYVLGAGKDAKVLPQNYDPYRELTFLNSIAATLLRHSTALCYFNPNGEILMDRDALNQSLAHNSEHNLPPLDVWTNVRMFSYDETWMLMDTVGCWQFDIPDHEAIFPSDAFSCNEVAAFLRNASLYVVQNGQVIKDGNTMDGPGGVPWQGKSFKNGISSPPRQVLRWLPTGLENIPTAFLKET